MKRLAWIVVVIVACGLSFGALTIYAGHPVPYKTLPGLRGFVNPSDDTLHIRFDWMNSALNITKYRFTHRNEGQRTVYQVTLLGGLVHNRSHLPKEIHGIQNSAGHFEFELIVAAPLFDKTRDHLVYLYRGQEHPIPIE